MTSNGQDVYQTRSVTFNATGATTLAVIGIDTYFAPTDTTCSQPSVGNTTRPNSNTLTVTSTALFGTVTADRVISVYARPFLNLPEGTGIGTIAVNSLTFASSYNQGGSDKFLVSVGGTNLAYSGGTTLDTNGYPTTFTTPATATTFIKQ